MLLSRSEILEEMAKGEIKIEPFEPGLVGPDAIDLRLGKKFMELRKADKPIDATRIPKDIYTEPIEAPEGYVLKPNTLVLGTTLEAVSLSNSISAQLEGRSSLGRAGILVHMTAGIVHAGFGKKEPSTLTLEIYSVNPNPVVVKPGMRIAQLSFMRLGKEAEKGYDEIAGSKYIAQKGPLPPGEDSGL
ncbi:MAG: dCTP deaminase [Candidatus Anstonellales archaeon]